MIITTTTHMAYEPDRPFANGGDKVLVEKNLRQFGYTVAAEWTQGAVKVGSLPEKQLRELKDCCDVFLIEADGSKQLPLKVPENWEPVIPSIADLVISVVGLDCLGKPIRQTAHRMERTSEFLKKSLDAPVTPEDVVKIASSICGLFKKCGGQGIPGLSEQGGYSAGQRASGRNTERTYRAAYSGCLWEA